MSSMIKITVVFTEFDISYCCGSARLCWKVILITWSVCSGKCPPDELCCFHSAGRQRGCTPTSARLPSSCTSIHNIPAHVSEVSRLYEHLNDRHIHINNPKIKATNLLNRNFLLGSLTWPVHTYSGFTALQSLFCWSR